MNIKPFKHEDDRRILTEWISNSEVRTCKILEVKQDSVLGNHYHNKKVDTFYLLKGYGTYKIGDEEGIMYEGKCLRAEIGQPHTFSLRAGSILLESASTPYDKEDEIQITN